MLKIENHRRKGEGLWGAFMEASRRADNFGEVEGVIGGWIKSMLCTSHLGFGHRGTYNAVLVMEERLHCAAIKSTGMVQINMLHFAINVSSHLTLSHSSGSTLQSVPMTMDKVYYTRKSRAGRGIRLAARPVR